MADPFSPKQIGGTGRIPHRQQSIGHQRFGAGDAAGHRPAMAIQHRAGAQAAALNQTLKGSSQAAGTRTIRRWEVTDPHLQPLPLHGKDPAVSMGDPGGAQKETDPIPPGSRLTVIGLQQPLNADALQQRILGIGAEAGLLQQISACTGGINQPAR